VKDGTAASAFLQRFGPWALVTGASSGIGAEFARQLAGRGFNLVLVARRKQRLDDLAQRLNADTKSQIKVIAVDLAHPDFLRVILAEILEFFFQTKFSPQGSLEKMPGLETHLPVLK